jgi:ABC-type antimicrobial peptide transport system permease subunit
VVTQRMLEMGVRIALGAQRSYLLWLVMRQAGALLVTGLSVGTGLALAAGRLVQGFLYGVSAHDGWTLAAAVVFLFASGVLRVLCTESPTLKRVDASHEPEKSA